MTHVLKWTRRGRFVDRGRGLEVVGGETVAVGDSDYAGHLIDRGFSRVVNVDPDDADHAVDVDGSARELTAEGGGDGSGRMDYGAFADMGYRDRVNAVLDGRVDHLLDRIEAEDQSQNVQDAVDTRRDGGD